MTPSASNRVMAILAVATALLLVFSGWISVTHFWLQAQVAFSCEQSRDIEEMRKRAVEADTPDAAEILRYVSNDSPSESELKKFTGVARIVERQRAMVIREIIAALRSKTGEDLGELPGPWIKKYAKQ